MRGATSGNQPSTIRNLLRLPAFLIANVALFLLIGISTARETYRGWTVDKEIHALQANAETLEGRKLQLFELTNSLNSPEQVELDARRLGWKKEGEQVAVLTGYHPTSVALNVQTSLPPEPEAVSNPKLWFNYFFHPEKSKPL
jgi:hypothetical protein